MQLDRDFKEFVACFLTHDVRFLAVGGDAMAAHGAPRYTGDFDAWIRVDPGNATRVIAALDQFGFGALGVVPEDFARPDQIVQLGYRPYRIDILTSIGGVEFSDAWERRMTVEIDGMHIDFIGTDDLIATTRAAGRPQDLADIDRLSR